MLFYGPESVAHLAEAFGADLVVTRLDNSKILSRYGPAWDALEADARFQLFESSSPALRVFRYSRSPALASTEW